MTARVKVRRSAGSYGGLFGYGPWWDIYVGLGKVAVVQHWADAQVIAGLYARSVHQEAS